MNYKCPYCLYSFTEEQVIKEMQGRGVEREICPNPALRPNSEIKLCGKRLPINFMESETIVVALTGAKGVGKTYYYVALIDQLCNNHQLKKIGIHGKPIGTENEVRKLLGFLDQYRRGERLLTTTSIESALLSVIELRIKKDGILKYVYISFFDNPGEGFAEIDYMIDHLPNTYIADGLLFLIEPLQIPKFAKKLANKFDYLKQQVDSIEDLQTVLNNIVQILKKVNNKISVRKPTFTRPIFNSIPIKRKVKTPFAIAISKFDLLKSFINVTIPFDDTQFENMCINNNGFDEEIVNIISSEIEEVITGEPDGEIEIKDLLSDAIKDYAYFGVRSIDVDEKGNFIRINAQGVLLPLIWLLRKLQLY